MDSNYKKTDEEIQFLRKALTETSQLSKEWLKTLKKIIATLCITIMVGAVVFGYVCNLYFRYAYDAEGYEKNNTNTNINKNINENK